MTKSLHVPVISGVETLAILRVAHRDRAVRAHEDLAARDDDAVAVAFGRLAGGDLEALAVLYDLMAARLYGFALWRTDSREDAAEVVQEVFVRLAGSRADLSKVRTPRCYVYRIAHVAAIDVLRRRRRDAPVDDALVVAAARNDDERVDASRVTAMLRRLPAPQREAVYLRHFAGLSFAEIGDAASVPTFTAASRYRLGIARLRQLLGVNR